MPSMTIAALARSGGVGVETVRYYQKRGLLPTPKRLTGFGVREGVRRYGEAEVGQLRFIRSAQAAGFTLNEIEELLRLDAIQDRTRIRAMASDRINVLNARIAELSAARTALQSLARECDTSGGGPCPIATTFLAGFSAQAERIDAADDTTPT